MARGSADRFGAGDRVAVEDPVLDTLPSNEGVVTEVSDAGAVVVALDGAGAFPFPAESVRLLKRAPAVAAKADAEEETARQVHAGNIVTYHHHEGDRPAMVVHFDGMSRPWLVLDFEGLVVEGKLRLDLAVENRSLVLNAIEGTGPGRWSRPSS